MSYNLKLYVLTIMLSRINEPRREKNMLLSYANNKAADQPAHPRSLISAFVVHCHDSIIHLLAKAEISRLCLSRPVWVLPGRKPGRHVFSWCGSNLCVIVTIGLEQSSCITAFLHRFTPSGPYCCISLYLLWIKPTFYNKTLLIFSSCSLPTPWF